MAAQEMQKKKSTPQHSTDTHVHEKIRTYVYNTHTHRKTTMMTRLMQLIHELTKKGIHSTKRDLFYSDVKLFEKQTQSDSILEELALMFGCTRHSLSVRIYMHKSTSIHALPVC